jgi:hypothetical protein
MATSQPASAREIASTRPMPCPAPVTMALRPFRLKRSTTVMFNTPLLFIFLMQ